MVCGMYTQGKYNIPKPLVPTPCPILALSYLPTGSYPTSFFGLPVFATQLSTALGTWRQAGSSQKVARHNSWEGALPLPLPLLLGL